MDFDSFAKHPIGELFTDPHFLSTSLSEEATLKKNFKIVLFVPKGARGGYIEKISKYPQQLEFLLDRNSKLRVLSRNDNKVFLEVIP